MDVTVRGMPRVSGVNVLLNAMCSSFAIGASGVPIRIFSGMQVICNGMSGSRRYGRLAGGQTPFWAVPRSRDESFIVRDASGQALWPAPGLVDTRLS